MGGMGSGGGRGARKLNELLSLQLSGLKRAGFIGRRKASDWVWRIGDDERGRITIFSDDDGLMLKYRARASNGEWEPISDRIWLSWTTPHYGGRRAWFICPSCQNRRTALYGGRLFRCRTCRRATYPSQYHDVIERTVRRADQIERRLAPNGSNRAMLKPKGMHWATYDRLISEHAEQQRLAWVSALHLLNRPRG